MWQDVGIYDGGERVGPRTDKERALLARLLLARGTRVSRASLIDWIWERPPASADNDVSKHMTALRKHLGSVGMAEALESRDGLCRLDVPESEVDAHKLRRLVAEFGATTAMPVADMRSAAAALDQVLRETGGDALAGLSGAHVEPHRLALREVRFEAALLHVRYCVELGRHREQVAVLTTLFAENQGDAAVAALAMRVLHLVGRGTEAADTFTRHRAHLVDHGHDVSREVLEMQTRILNDDPDLAPLASREAGPRPAGFPHPPDDLVLAFSSEDGDLDALVPQVANTLGIPPLRASRRDGVLVCVVPGDTARRVIGKGLDQLADRLDRRVRVGAAFGNQGLARALALSETALAMLHNAGSRCLAVTVAEDIYQSVDHRDLDAYRQAEDGTTGWVRVPGYSLPPAAAPAESTDGPSEAWQPTTKRGPVVVFNGRTRINRQHIGDVVHNPSPRSGDSGER